MLQTFWTVATCYINIHLPGTLLQVVLPIVTQLDIAKLLVFDDFILNPGLQ